jgi:hypothetical protein
MGRCGATRFARNRSCAVSVTNAAPQTAIARPMPRPTAQAEPYVDILGPELTMQFLLQFGGAELYLSADPKGRSAVETLLGYHKAKELAARPSLTMQRRIPLAKRWLAAMMNWQGHSTAHIARTLRVTDASVRKWLKEAKG